jgi:hypothetical protein
MKASFAGEKDAIRFGVIGGAYLINVLTHVACDRCPVFAYVLHFFKHRGAVFIRQSQKEIFYRPCSARCLIIASLPFMP